MGKICTKCKRELLTEPVSYFGHNKDAKDGWNWECKECKRTYLREYSKTHKEQHKERNSRSRGRLRNFVVEYLLAHPCVDCGEDDIVVLDFDHRNSSQKEKCISQVFASCWSIKKLSAEISKCDIRCANCHRRRHGKSWLTYRYKQQNTQKVLDT
jgi:hypothetical protein